MQTIITQYAVHSERYPQKIPILLTDIHPFLDNTLPSTECLNATLEHMHWKYLAQPTCSSDQIMDNALQRENNPDVRME
jgi:hypothetical protein